MNTCITFFSAFCRFFSQLLPGKGHVMHFSLFSKTDCILVASFFLSMIAVPAFAQSASTIPELLHLESFSFLDNAEYNEVFEINRKSFAASDATFATAPSEFKPFPPKAVLAFQELLQKSGPRALKYITAFHNHLTQIGCVLINDQPVIDAEQALLATANQELASVDTTDPDAVADAQDEVDRLTASVAAMAANPPKTYDDQDGRSLIFAQEVQNLSIAYPPSPDDDAKEYCDMLPNPPEKVEERILYASACYTALPTCVMEFDFPMTPEDYSPVSDLTALSGVKPGRTLKVLERCDEAKGGFASVDGSRLSIVLDPVTNQVRNYDNAETDIPSGEMVVWLAPESLDGIFSLNNFYFRSVGAIGADCGNDIANCGVYGAAVGYRIPIAGDNDMSISVLAEVGVVGVTGANTNKAQGTDIAGENRVRPWIAIGSEFQKSISENWSFVTNAKFVIQPGIGVEGMVGVRYAVDDGPEFTCGPTLSSIPNMNVPGGPGVTGGRNSGSVSNVGNVGMPFGLGVQCSLRWEWD